MIRCEAAELLHLADLIPDHNLRRVQEQPNFNTWGVDFRPNKLPETLLIGENSQDFGAPCWPFMAAHEALHSIATHFFASDDYHFFLYNICEDWRINSCLRGMFEELESSYQSARQAILRRWEREPLRLKSPVSQVLQHLCYLNHLCRKDPSLPLDSEYLLEVTRIRDQFQAPENWPLIESAPDRYERNRETSQRLIRLIQKHQPPSAVNPGEIRTLIQRMGFDLTFRLHRENQQISP